MKLKSLIGNLKNTFREIGFGFSTNKVTQLMERDREIEIQNVFNTIMMMCSNCSKKLKECVEVKFKDGRKLFFCSDKCYKEWEKK